MPYQHLTAQDRIVIAHLKDQGYGPRAIGRQLQRPAGTISRELSRNASAKDGYEAPSAQTSASTRRRKANAKRTKLKANTPLLKKVKEGLKQKWSPKLISDQLKHQNIRDEDGQPLRISHWVFLVFLIDDFFDFVLDGSLGTFRTLSKAIK